MTDVAALQKYRVKRTPPLTRTNLPFVLVQLKSGEIYRGLLVSAEDTMNVSLSDVIRTARNGQISKLPNVYLRGSSIRFIALPDLLKNAPVFKKVQTMKRKMEESQSQQRGGSGGGKQNKRKRTE